MPTYPLLTALTVACGLFALTTLPACGADAANERATEVDTPAEEVREELGYTDPVCGMEVAEGAAVEHVHEGVTYGFCSEACRDKFAAAPQDYIADAAQ